LEAPYRFAKKPGRRRGGGVGRLYFVRGTYKYTMGDH
jgi:hypothetical protein